MLSIGPLWGASARLCACDEAALGRVSLLRCTEGVLAAGRALEGVLVCAGVLDERCTDGVVLLDAAGTSAGALELGLIVSA